MQVEFPEGNIVRFIGNFTDETTGTPVDPTAVAFAYQVNGGTPVQSIYVDGDASVGTIIRDAAGTYHIDIDSTGLPGSWTFEWESKGVGQASIPGAIVVSAIPIPIVWS